MSFAAAAFLSYSHEDNQLDGGGVVTLANDLVNEYSLTSGQPLELFVDRSSISWGDEWRERINNALRVTTFFIPIITPRYFTRTECRNEFITFSTQAQAIGASELILPIMYAPVAQLDDSNPDEVIALASRYQYVDWTTLRLEGSRSPEYRKEVYKLAKRLIDVSEIIASRQLNAESEMAAPSEQVLGVLDLISQIKDLFPDWLDAIESASVGNSQIDATFQVYGPRLLKLEQQKGQAGAKFAILNRVGTEAIPLGRHQLAAAQIYARKSLELDTLVTRLLDIAESGSVDLTLLEEIFDSVRQAEQGIRHNEQLHANGAVVLGEWARRRAHLSRTINQMSEVFTAYSRVIGEANGIVARWLSRIDALQAHAVPGMNEVEEYEPREPSV